MQISLYFYQVKALVCKGLMWLESSSIWMLLLLSIQLITKSKLKPHQWPRTGEKDKRFCQQRSIMSSQMWPHCFGSLLYGMLGNDNTDWKKVLHVLLFKHHIRLLKVKYLQYNLIRSPLKLKSNIITSPPNLVARHSGECLYTSVLAVLYHHS